MTLASICAKMQFKPRLTYLAGALFVAALQVQAAGTSATLTLPSNALGRSGQAVATLRFEHGLTGRGELRVRWTDALGRIVEDSLSFVSLHDEIELTFAIDLSRAIAMKNHLEAHLSIEESTPKGLVKTEEQAAIDFVASPNVDGWKDYAIIMYQRYPSNVQPALKLLGVNGGKYDARNEDPPDYLLDNNMRWYSENIAPDFYAEYHRWRSDRPYDWSLDQAKQLYAADPTSKEAFKRHPSFRDPEWRSRVRDRIVDVVKRNMPYQPFFYSLSDETGIASLGSAWDFDFSDQSLVPMREWLRMRYGSLDALNAEWETSFQNWHLVTPFTTNEAMQRKGDNFSPWADFKEWMDVSYADALHMGVQAAHQIDPAAVVGIVGAQKPGWGGYDYSRLAQAVDVMEPYDIGGSVKLAHSLNPKMPLLSTAFATGNWEKHRVWFELLQGGSGLILWDDPRHFIMADGSRGQAGQEVESYYNEIRNGLGALILNSSVQDDGIAIHYSQPSMRTEWMLERRPDGQAWMHRDAAYERSHNNFMRLRESWGHAIEDQGLQYRFVSYTQVEDGELLAHGYHLLVLPHSTSLSAQEAENIRQFIRSGGVVVADGLPGTFDEHSRRLAASQLAELFPDNGIAPLTVKTYGAGKAVRVKTTMLEYLQDRITGNEAATNAIVRDLFQVAGVQPEISVTDENGKPIVGLLVHVFQNGGVRLLSIQSNPQQSVDELGPPNFHSNKRFEEAHNVHIQLPSSMYVCDVRGKKYLGKQQTFTMRVDAYEPTILALTDEAPAVLQISVPDKAKPGTIVPISMRLPAAASATQVYHVDIFDPSGKRLLQYSGNIVSSGGAALKQVPLAENDTPGKWTIRVEDMLTGHAETRMLYVR